MAIQKQNLMFPSYFSDDFLSWNLGILECRWLVAKNPLAKSGVSLENFLWSWSPESFFKLMNYYREFVQLPIQMPSYSYLEIMLHNKYLKNLKISRRINWLLQQLIFQTSFQATWFTFTSSLVLTNTANKKRRESVKPKCVIINYGNWIETNFFESLSQGLWQGRTLWCSHLKKIRFYTVYFQKYFTNVSKFSFPTVLPL